MGGMKQTIRPLRTLVTILFFAITCFAHADHCAEHQNPEKKDEPTVCLEDPAETLFNGKDLKGWTGDPRFWSVKDGVIHGTTLEHKADKGNTFLIYEGEDVGDFHLVVEARCMGKNNSGVMYRSKAVEGNPYALAGYQCDIHANPPFTAMLYGERMGKRGIITTRGEKMTINQYGKKKLISMSKPGPVDISQWNTYEIICKGNHIIHMLNGEVAIDLIDDDPSKLLKGKIGLQLHAGAPMQAEFRNIRLERLDKNAPAQEAAKGE